MSNNNSDKINLTFPINAAYVSAARLTASSIANRMGFDIDEIEDIKTAVSEASTYIIKHYDSKEEKNLHVTFYMHGKTMKIKLKVENMSNVNIDNEDMGLVMISALMEDFSLENESKDLIMMMTKNHKEYIL